jgi:hypothetical protein
MRHAGAVDLGIDVADQIGLQVEVLDQASGSSVLALAGMVGETPRRAL